MGWMTARARPAFDRARQRWRFVDPPSGTQNPAPVVLSHKQPALSRRIVETYLARMAVADLQVVRKNLSEGLYIMLDENLGGGVSLQKNVDQLPKKMRPGILEARRVFERDVLFSPLLAALASGNELRRPASSRRSTDRSSRADFCPAARGDDRRRQRSGVRLSV